MRLSSSRYIHPETEKYADQRRVFDDLGTGILSNAWKGFNCSLFAYGQTGSGKSYSMLGYGENKGIVPMACEMLFDQIAQARSGIVLTTFESVFQNLSLQTVIR